MLVKEKLLILTYIPSPYQVELFNAIEQSGLFSLKVAYLYARSNTPIAKKWESSNLQHDYLILDDRPESYLELEADLVNTDLVIFNYYRHPQINKLIDRCIQTQTAWCFWGERPGFQHSGLLGFLYRRWKLSRLHQFSIPIWGVGEWGVKQYRQEFGTSRKYFNIPYFSDLARFQALADNPKNFNARSRVFLYSGALIHRKGVDLLASAFCKLADEFPNIRLNLIGEGELRPNLEQQLIKYQERVTFLGFQSWDKLPSYYQQADILCVPSRYDGWALVVPEGLSAGLPVISTNRTGAALDLIDNEKNGWLIPSNCESALYQAMKQAAMLSASELADYSQAALVSVNRHSLKDGVNKFQEAVRETLYSFA
jgi:glycosyltransferase involved in cell wall biosynthesis